MLNVAKATPALNFYFFSQIFQHLTFLATLLKRNSGFKSASMVFSSFFFLFAFLPLTVVLYALTPKKFKNIALLLMSTLFYGWGALSFVPVVFVVCAIDYFLGRRILVATGKTRTLLVSIGVAFDLLLLGYCKYANFFVTEVSNVLQCFGFEAFSWTTVALPLGISFFTFHRISYLVDLYRGVAQGAETLLDYFLYVLFFPQLIAGPIIRYSEIAEQLRSRTVTREDVSYGIWRFVIGLSKKVLIADLLGVVADHIFVIPTAQLSIGYAWLGVLSYSFQIYYDFSGYSDMAVGLARLFGFRIIENFNRPYLSRNFTEFWRRWHISLSNFMREYVYIPLGGNQGNSFRVYANLWVVFLLSGFWHGAAWNFIIWGAFHGFFLSIDKIVKNSYDKLPKFLQISGTFFLVTMGWVLFRADTLSHAVEIFGALFGFQNATEPLLLSQADIINNRATAVGVIAVVVTWMPEEWWRKFFRAEDCASYTLLSRCATSILLFLLATFSLSAAGFSPFLYFKF